MLIVALQGFNSDLLLEQGGDRGEEGNRQGGWLVLRQVNEFLDSGEGAEVGGGEGDTGVICSSSQASPTKDHRKLCLLPLEVRHWAPDDARECLPGYCIKLVKKMGEGNGVGGAKEEDYLGEGEARFEEREF